MTTKTAPEHPHAKQAAPTRSGWTAHSIHRCPICTGIARLGLQRTSAPVPTGPLLVDQSGGWYGNPVGWSEVLTPGGLVAISSDHAHFGQERAWCYNSGRTCPYEVWTTERGAVPIIDQLIDDWLFPSRSYWDRGDGLRFGETVTDFDLDALIKGGWVVRAKDERGGPPILLTLTRAAAIYRADTGKLPLLLGEALHYSPKKDFELLRRAFLLEIKATTKPRRS